MKRLIVSLVALMIAAPALADTISVTVSSPSVPDAGNTRTKSFTISTADLQAAITAAQSPCNVSINGTCTTDQVLDFISTWMMKQAADWVKQATTQTTTTAKTITIQ
jgi:hypothetical protein